MSAILDVCIGLVLMYLVLSLFCTTINEFIAKILNLRATTLQGALEQMIDDPNLKALFDDHGLIEGSRVAASAGRFKSTAEVAVKRLAGATNNSLLKKIGAAIGNGGGALPSYLSGQSVALALIGSLGTKDDNPIPGISQIEQAVKNLPDSNIRDMLGTALAQANTDINVLRTNIASWFDDSMDRLSGAYKRKLKLISFLVGIVVAVGFNADTIHVVDTLWSNPVLRSQAVDAAANIVKNGGQIPDSGTCKDATKGAKNGARTGAAEGSSTQSTTISGDALTLCKLTNQATLLPIGWPDPNIHRASWPSDLVLKLVGLWLTAIALSLGAPFWFDVLSQFMNLRGSGDKPARTTS